jgi:antitoxin component of MazEF toxin-antitoxin module
MLQVCISVNKLSESTDTGVIIVRPIRQRLKLDELLDKITPNNLPDLADIEWGQPKGGEEW